MYYLKVKSNFYTFQKRTKTLSNFYFGQSFCSNLGDYANYSAQFPKKNYVNDLDWPCPVSAALHLRPQKMTGNGCISFYQSEVMPDLLPFRSRSKQCDLGFRYLTQKLLTLKTVQNLAQLKKSLEMVQSQSQSQCGTLNNFSATCLPQLAYSIKIDAKVRTKTKTIPVQNLFRYISFCL